MVPSSRLGDPFPSLSLSLKLFFLPRRSLSSTEWCGDLSSPSCSRWSFVVAGGEYRTWENSVGCFVGSMPGSGPSGASFLPPDCASLVFGVSGPVLPVALRQSCTTKMRRAGKQQQMTDVLASISVQISAYVEPQVVSVLLALPFSKTMRAIDAAIVNAPRAKTAISPVLVFCFIFSELICGMGKANTCEPLAGYVSNQDKFDLQQHP